MDADTTGILAGRRILVTGGSKGIGAAIVRALHRDGAEVVVHFGADAAAAAELLVQLGGRVHPVGADLGEPGAADRLWAEAKDRLGGIDALIANAGAWIGSPLADVQEWDAGWEANLQLNLRSAADLCLLRSSTSAPEGGGSIITMTSRSAHRGDDADHLAYGAAKPGCSA